MDNIAVRKAKKEDCKEIMKLIQVILKWNQKFFIESYKKFILGIIHSWCFNLQELADFEKMSDGVKIDYRGMNSLLLLQL